MILVTGATGFVGRALLPRLAELGAEVRCLIQPSKKPPRLPKGATVQVAISTVTEFRGVRAAMSGVDTVIHLASAEWKGRRGDLEKVDIEGTRKVIEAAKEAGVTRLIYLSQLSAEKLSAFETCRVKGQIEEMIKRSGLAYTIVRSSILFGAEDVFANGLARLLALSPGVFILPGEGRALMQPLWVEDLVTCLSVILEDPTTLNQTYSLGGPEFLSLEQMMQTIMAVTKIERPLVRTHFPIVRWVAGMFEVLSPHPLITARSFDHFAVNRLCELVSVTRYFGIKPSRFEQTIGYMANKNLSAEALQHMWG
jgi:NADH dehydrogenase